MNHRLILNQVGKLLFLLAAAMLAMALFSAIDALRGMPGEGTALRSFLFSALATGGAGALLFATTKPGRGTAAPQMVRREALLLVLASWIVGAAAAALPFWTWGLQMGDALPEPAFGGYVPCFFESMSGLTTCGASVLGLVESYPRSILLWRSSTHWLGGLGIVVLFVAVLPSLGAAGKRIFLAESTGITPEGLRPQVRETARILWMIYAGLTTAQVVLLLLAGMGGFDAVCHAFGTVATGGFSTRNASIASYHSVAIELIIVLFMFLGSVNFALYHRLMRRQHRLVWRDTELRWFGGIVVGATALVAFSLWVAGRPIVMVDGTSLEATPLQSLRSALFVVTSMQSTTGYCTADYEHWPVVANAAIVVVMLVGGCGGSTAGGIKVIRSIIAFMCLRFEVEREYRPTVVRPLLVGTSAIDAQSRLAAMVMLVAALLLVPAGGAVLLAIEPDPRMDLATAVSACLASFSVVGPGFGAVGATKNYGWMSDQSLAVLSAMMLVGRLEVFAGLAVISRKFWRGT